MLPTTASTGTGVDEVVEALDRHRGFVGDDAERADARGRAASRRAARHPRRGDAAAARGAACTRSTTGIGALLASVRRGDVDPYSAALRMLADDDALAALVREAAS